MAHPGRRLSAGDGNVTLGEKGRGRETIVIEAVETRSGEYEDNPQGGI